MQIDIQMIANASIVVTIENKVKFAMDPALAPQGTSIGFGIKSKYQPVYDQQTYDHIDFWLLTHNHKDHLDQAGLEQIKADDLVIAPKQMAKFLKQNKKKNQKLLNWHETTEVIKDDLKVEIKAIPAIHGHNPLIVALMGKVNGYLVKITSGEETKYLYFTSDAIYNKNYETVLKTIGAIDLLILNLGGAKSPVPISKKPITLNKEEAELVIQTLKPKYSLGIHVDEYEHFTTTRSEVEQIADIIALGASKTYYL